MFESNMLFFSFRKCSSMIQYDVYRLNKVSIIPILNNSIHTIYLFQLPLLYLWRKRERNNLNFFFFVMQKNSVHLSVQCLFLLHFCLIHYWFCFFILPWTMCELMKSSFFWFFLLRVRITWKIINLYKEFHLQSLSHTQIHTQMI